jgi:glycosyltransferase involved in cell wall biosynthesis
LNAEAILAKDSTGTPMKFSLITVCRNSAATIAQTIESVLGQSCQDWEHLIIDGASTDATASIVKSYEARYAGRLKFVSEPDKGIYDAMNKGLALASGQLVGIINSDDWYEPDALENVAKAAEASPGFDVYYGMVRFVDGKGGEIGVQRGGHLNLAKETLCHQGCFVSAAAYRKHGLFNLDYRIVADYEFFLRLRRGGGSFLPVDRILASYGTAGVSSTALLRLELEKGKAKQAYALISKKEASLLLAKAYLKTFFFWCQGKLKARRP